MKHTRISVIKSLSEKN